MDSTPAEVNETDYRRDDDEDEELIEALTLYDNPCMSY